MAGLFGSAALIVSAVFLLGILAALLFHKIIGWYISGDISGLHCVIIGGLYIGVLLLIITCPSIAVKVILFLLLVVLSIAGPILGRKLIYERGTHRFHDEEIEKYRRVIGLRPDNLAARSLLAEELHKRGHLDEAIAELSQLVELRPHDLQESHRLKSYLEEREERRAPPRTCPSCGRKNAAELTVCAYCGSELSFARETARWLAGGGIKQILIPFAITAGVITIVIVALGLLALPYRILLVALTVIVILIAALVHMCRPD